MKKLTWNGSHLILRLVKLKKLLNWWLQTRFKVYFSKIPTNPRTKHSQKYAIWWTQSKAERDGIFLQNLIQQRNLIKEELSYKSLMLRHKESFRSIMKMEKDLRLEWKQDLKTWSLQKPLKFQILRTSNRLVIQNNRVPEKHNIFQTFGKIKMVFPNVWKIIPNLWKKTKDRKNPFLKTKRDQATAVQESKLRLTSMMTKKKPIKSQ